MTKRTGTGELYALLQEAWRAEMASELPDWRKVQEIHQRLCALEDRRRKTSPAECMRNLYRRLQAAWSLGLDLDRPYWASLEDLDEQLKALEGWGADREGDEAA